MDDGIRPLSFTRYLDGAPQKIIKQVIRESLWTLHVNGREWLDILCTPWQMKALIYGFLRNEGVIASVEDVSSFYLYGDGHIAVRLRNPDVVPPPRRALTTGCGGGTTFADLASAFEPVISDLTLTPGQVLGLMKALHASAVLYQASGGVHASALASGDQLLVVAEDVGRHNTLDKICGECMLRGLVPQGKILLTTGRISSEMLIKAVRMKVPVLASHSSPTDFAIRLARQLDVTLIGYTRSNRFDVYAGEQRIHPDEESVLVDLSLPAEVYSAHG